MRDMSQPAIPAGDDALPTRTYSTAKRLFLTPLTDILREVPIPLIRPHQQMPAMPTAYFDRNLFSGARI